MYFEDNFNIYIFSRLFISDSGFVRVVYNVLSFFNLFGIGCKNEKLKLYYVVSKKLWNFIII